MSARRISENLERYCESRCDKYPACSNCKCDTRRGYCYIGFFIELYEVIDLKTLTKLSYYDMPDVYEIYATGKRIATTGDFENWLSNNKQYKITKKERY